MRVLSSRPPDLANQEHRRSDRAWTVLCAMVFVLSARAQEPGGPPPVAFTLTSPFAAGVALPAPEGRPMREAAFALGRRLFGDPILSVERTLSCAHCHRPEHGFAEPRARALDDSALRNTPTLYNLAFHSQLSWDGRATTLEQQVLMPIENPREMALPIDVAIARLAADPDYATAFAAIDGDAPSRAVLAEALATFVRSITLGDSPVDRFFAGRPNSLSREEKAGLWIYESKGRCWKCHVQPTFSDDRFHATGVGVVDGRPTDPGRFAQTGIEADRARFRTPTLRGLAFTAPYMHDGSLATLEDVVAFYRRGGNPHPGLDERIEPLELTDDDARHLVAFLRALSRSEAATPSPMTPATSK